MAAIVPVARAAASRSAGFSLPTTSGTDTVSNEALVAVLAPGPLRTLLTATYGTLALFLAAAGRAGMSMVAMGGVDVCPTWVVSSSTPSLSLTAAAISEIAVRISVSNTIAS